MARKATTIKKSTPKKSVSVVTKPKKSGFTAGTLIAVLMLLALSLFAVYVNREKQNKATATPAGESTTFVFTEADGLLKSIEVKPTAGETVKVARDAKNVWVLELPIKTEANQSSAEAAASQVSALQVLSQIPADGDPSIFGFDSPAFIMTIGFADGITHTLEVGGITPSQNGYYVRLDKGKMMIVDVSGINSLVQLANFPPYLNTPTPSPLPPTGTPVSPTDGAPTPDLFVTPSP